MSKRKSVQNRTEVLLGLAFAAVGVVMVVAPGSGGAYAGAFTALCAAIGYAGARYQEGETARPSGTLPTPGEVER